MLGAQSEIRAVNSTDNFFSLGLYNTDHRFVTIEGQNELIVPGEQAFKFDTKIRVAQVSLTFYLIPDFF